MTDADYLAVFHQVLLPMASEVSNMLRYASPQESLLRSFFFKVASEIIVIQV
jgi:hypothetical protein